MQNLHLEQYFSGVLRILADMDDSEIELRDSRHHRQNAVRFIASVRYHDGSRVRIRLLINTDSDYPEWSAYSFHYVTNEDATLFRYDNAIHYPDMHTFPHHKHEGAGERVMPSHRPSVRQIRDEIAAHLEAN